MEVFWSGSNTALFLFQFHLLSIFYMFQLNVYIPQKVGTFIAFDEQKQVFNFELKARSLKL